MQKSTKRTPILMLQCSGVADHTRVDPQPQCHTTRVEQGTTEMTPDTQRLQSHYDEQVSGREMEKEKQRV